MIKKLKLKKKNKKGQMDFPIIGFIVIAIALIIIAPVMLMVFNQINIKVGDTLGNVTSGGSIAKDNFRAVMNKGIAWWDTVIVCAFIIAMILLIISSFLIDTHPVFIILYVLICFFTIIFIPNIINSVDALYTGISYTLDSGATVQMSVMLPFLEFLRTYFGEVLVGVMLLTGIIIFGKVALMGRNR
jgi:hypothetical protein